MMVSLTMVVAVEAVAALAAVAAAAVAAMDNGWLQKRPETRVSMVA